MKIAATEKLMAAWSSGRRAEVIAWAVANGLVPENVVAATGFTVEDGQIHYHEFVRDAEGRVQLVHDKPTTTPRTAPLVVPFPGDPSTGVAMTTVELLKAFQHMVRKQDYWRGYVGWDDYAPTDAEVEDMLEDAIDAVVRRDANRQPGDPSSVDGP